ncbi:cytochrome c maturation protein CcmE [Oligella ureolytica]
MSKRQKRLLWVLALVLVLITCTVLSSTLCVTIWCFSILRQMCEQKKFELDKYVRVGGLVKPGTLVKHVGSIQIEFPFG